MSAEKKIVVILPAYNEESTIASTMAEFFRKMPRADIVVVDNRSADRTAEVAASQLKALGASGMILREPRPGKANALRKAFREVDADIYVMADADLTYSADDLPTLLAPVMNGLADMVVGNRHANAVYRAQNTRPLHDFGNNLVRWLINTLFHTQLSDIMTGYRVLSYRFVKSFPILSEGFEVETEMTLHAAHHRLAVQELPIDYRKRPEGSFSKLNTFSDGFRVLKMVLWIFKDYRPLPFFFALSFLAFALGLLIGVPVITEFMHTGLVPKFPSAILATGLMVFSMLFIATGLLLDTVVKIQRANFELELLRRFPHPFRKVPSGEQ